MSLIGIRILNKKDNDYWQVVWKRQRLLNLFWKHVYTEGGMSWQEIFDYLNSGDFSEDVTQDLFDIAQANIMDDSLNR